jgi:hypothetical protein
MGMYNGKGKKREVGGIGTSIKKKLKIKRLGVSFFQRHHLFFFLFFKNVIPSRYPLTILGKHANKNKIFPMLYTR